MGMTWKITKDAGGDLECSAQSMTRRNQKKTLMDMTSIKYSKELLRRQRQRLNAASNDNIMISRGQMSLMDMTSNTQKRGCTAKGKKVESPISMIT